MLPLAARIDRGAKVCISRGLNGVSFHARSSPGASLRAGKYCCQRPADKWRARSMAPVTKVRAPGAVCLPTSFPGRVVPMWPGAGLGEKAC